MKCGGFHSARALVLLGSAALPVGSVNGFQPLEFLFLFQVHFFNVKT